MNELIKKLSETNPLSLEFVKVAKEIVKLYKETEK